MTRIVVLDTGPLGIVTNPRQNATTSACRQWLRELLVAGARVVLPEIADYELRRELLRAGKTIGLQRLDALTQVLEYAPLTTEAMRTAAELWAKLRQQGLPTADARALDADAILAAQALLAVASSDTVVVATTNVGHLTRLVPAHIWEDTPHEGVNAWWKGMGVVDRRNLHRETDVPGSATVDVPPTNPLTLGTKVSA